MSGQEENPVIKILEQFEANGVEYVVWKNQQEIENALGGWRDIDLFIPIYQRGEMHRIFKVNSWVQADKKFKRYPWITHYYFYSGTGAIFHLHVYNKIITGESRLKEYQLPIESYLLENRYKNARNLWCLTPSAQSYVFILRHFMKGGSLFSRKLYLREILDYDDEFRKAGGRIDTSNTILDVLPKDLAKGSGLDKKPIQLPSWLEAAFVRFKMRPFLRGGCFYSIRMRLADLYFRVLQKAIPKTKKILPFGGVGIAVTGSDGAGKTTMLHEVSGELSKVFTVKNYHLGRPVPPSVLKLISLLSKLKKFLKGPRSEAIDIRKNEPVIKQDKQPSGALFSLILAYFRLRAARKCLRDIQKGCLVLVDRWPTLEMGAMDGPRIKSGNKNLQRLEAYLYSCIPSIDYCFIFQVSLETVVDRNMNRAEPEDDRMVRVRHELNKNPKPKASKTIVFNNDGALAPQLRRFRNEIWNVLSDSQF